MRRRGSFIAHAFILALTLSSFAHADKNSNDQVEKLLEKAQFQAAEALAKESIAASPSDLQNYVCLLETYQQSGQDQKVISTMREVAKRFAGQPPVIEQLLPFPARYMERNLPALAGDLYRALLEAFPRSPELLSSFGVVLLMDGDLKGAMKSFQAAYAQSPKDTIVTGNIAEASIFLRDFNQAKVFLKKTLELSPRRSSCLFDVAMIGMAEDPKTSLPAWDDYLEYAKKNPDGEWPETAETIKSSIEKGLSKDDLFAMAMQFNGNKLQKYAIPLLAYLSSKDPGDPNIPFMMAQSYEQAGFPELTMEQLRKSEQIQVKKPSHGFRVEDLFFNIARTAITLKDYETGISYLKKIERSNPNRANLQYTLGLASMDDGNLVQAKKYFHDCVSKPNNDQFAEYCKNNILIMAKLFPTPNILTYKAHSDADVHKNKESEHYDSDLGVQIAQRLNSLLIDCGRLSGQKSHLDFVFRVTDQGSIDQIYYSPNDRVAICVGLGLAAQTDWPKPPFAPFNDHLAIEFN